MEETF
jgi:hypothetical protein